MKLFLIKSNKDKYRVAQRVLSFQKKTKLTVMNKHSKLLKIKVCTHPFLLEEGVEVKPPTKKGGGSLTEPQLLEGVCWEREVTLFRGVAIFKIKINQNLK